MGYKMVEEVNLLEDTMENVEGATLAFKPFQIRSFKIIKE
jgi:hypothetical protein